MKIKITALAATAVISAVGVLGSGGSAHAMNPTYQWHNRNSGQCLDSGYSDTVGLGTVYMHTCEGLLDSNQRWVQNPYFGFYSLENADSGYYLVDEGTADHTLETIRYADYNADAFQFIAEPGGYYLIKDLRSGLCLESYNGARLYTCNAIFTYEEWWHTS